MSIVSASELFIYNTLFEGLAAILGLVRPSFLFTGSELSSSGREAATWWSCAALVLAVNTALGAHIPDDDEGKKVIGKGMLIYHTLLTFFMIIRVITRFSFFNFITLIGHSFFFYSFYEYVMTR
eukprot:TRINITY_DN2374_c0_g1_i2.p1 TRINITY_DN2374_c0_g1~~TRINITY_DN2374_c0_g1_i2.p1  ORF type:complete len:124 (-),score=29.41 TRINITY_DN2374_c0_g1_i2:86-457(-)